VGRGRNRLRIVLVSSMKHLHKILLSGSLTTTPKHDEVITIESFETNSVPKC
jgi:hypothetical protein